MFDLTLHAPETVKMNAAALDNLRNAINADIAKDRMYGGAMIVARQGKVVLRETFGTVGENRPAKLDDIYLMMSVTKSFTAALVLKAIDKGLISFDTKIADLFPEYAAEGKAATTIAHVLSHKAGLGIMPTPPAPLTLADLGDIDKVFAALCKEKPLFEVGTQSAYSSFVGFTVLAKVLEKIDAKGRKFAQIAQEELFAPLGMKDASYGGKAGDPRLVAVSHTPTMAEGFSTMGDVKGTEMFLNSLARPDCAVAGANAYDTIDDLFHFAETLRRNREGGNGEPRFLSAAMVKYATQNHCGELENLSFSQAWETQNMPPLLAKFGFHGGYARGEGHYLNVCGYTASNTAFGGMGGGSTFYMVDPQRELTVAFLSAGFIEGLDHLVRVAKLNDLALAACE